MTKDKIFTGLLILDSVLLLILVYSIFVVFKQKDTRSEIYKENLEQLETERTAIINEREAWSKLLQQKDKTIQSYRTIDSVVASNIKKQTTILTNIDKRNEKTAAAIRNYGSAELRSAFSEFE